MKIVKIKIIDGYEEKKIKEVLNHNNQITVLLIHSNDLSFHHTKYIIKISK